MPEILKRDINFKVMRLLKILHSLNANKASGVDGKPAVLLEQWADKLAPFITTLFQHSYDSEVLVIVEFSLP